MSAIDGLLKSGLRGDALEAAITAAITAGRLCGGCDGHGSYDGWTCGQCEGTGEGETTTRRSRA